jgi:hypothetical protein
MSDVDLNALNGNFKEAYADKIKDNVPNYAYVLKETELKKGVKLLGDKYNMPVKVQSGQGYTYNTDGSVFTLNSPVALQLENATVQSFTLVRQDNISWTAISRSANVNAFTRAMDLTIDDMTKGAGFRLENSYLHGQRGLGNISGVTHVSTTQDTVQLTPASWASGIWFSALNAQVQIYDTSGNLVSSGADSVFTVVSLSVANTTITVNGTTTGITALEAATFTTTGGNVYFNGSMGATVSPGTVLSVEGTGLLNIFSNTGTLFGINSGTFPQWTGNTYSAASGPLTFGKLEAAACLPGDRGLAGEDLDVLVPLRSFKDVLTEQAAARRYGDVKGKKMDNGADTLEFYSPTGTMDIIPHPLMKAGEAVLYPSDNLFRIGSSDLTFQLPGQDEGTYIMSAPISGKAGYFTSIFADNTIASDTPGHGCLITGVVPRT